MINRFLIAFLFLVVTGYARAERKINFLHLGMALAAPPMGLCSGLYVTNPSPKRQTILVDLFLKYSNTPSTTYTDQSRAQTYSILSNSETYVGSCNTQASWGGNMPFYIKGSITVIEKDGFVLAAGAVVGPLTTGSSTVVESTTTFPINGGKPF